MKVFAQTLELKDDPRLIAEYCAYHERIWPEVTEALRGVGIRRMKIFLHGNRLFMFYEAPDGFDPQRDYQAYTENPRAREWDALMRRYQQQIPSATPDSWWTPMREVFDLESQTGA